MIAGTTELRNRLSHFLRQVRRGARVVVMDRGRPIAQLVRFSGEGDLRGRIATLAEEGTVTAAVVRKRVPFKAVALHRPSVRASRLVSDMRDEQ